MSLVYIVLSVLYTPTAVFCSRLGNSERDHLHYMKNNHLEKLDRWNFDNTFRVSINKFVQVDSMFDTS